MPGPVWPPGPRTAWMWKPARGWQLVPRSWAVQTRPARAASVQLGVIPYAKRFTPTSHPSICPKSTLHLPSSNFHCARPLQQQPYECSLIPCTKYPVLGAWQPVSIPQPGSYAQVPLPLCFQPRDALRHRGTAPEGLLWPRLEQPRAFVAGLLWFTIRTSKNEALSVVPLCCFPSLWSLFLCTLLWLCAGLGHGPESISSPVAVQRPRGRAASSPVPRAPEQTRSMSPPESGGVG